MILERLKAGKKNRKTVKWPGTDQDVVLRILSDADLQQAHFDAERRFKTEGIEVSMATVDAYENEKTTQILYRALRDPLDVSMPVAKTVDLFRTLIDRTEKDPLVDEYTAFERECSPNLAAMTDEEAEAFYEELKKRPEILENVSNISIARRLISYLASRPQSSPAASGSIS